MFVGVQATYSDSETKRCYRNLILELRGRLQPPQQCDRARREVLIEGTGGGCLVRLP